MKFNVLHIFWSLVLPGVVILACTATRQSLAFTGGTDHSGPPRHIAEAWGLAGKDRGGWGRAAGIDVKLIQSSVAANVLFPGDKLNITMQVINENGDAIDADGKLEIRRYELTTSPNDFFTYDMRNLETIQAGSVHVKADAKKWANVSADIDIPERFGGYAIILDLGPRGRHLAALCVRALPNKSVREQFPVMTLDNLDPDLLNRIGARAIRLGTSYKSTTAPDYQQFIGNLRRELKSLHDHNITCMLNFNGGDHQVLGRWAHQLNDKDEMVGGYNDVMWPPAADEDFSKMVKSELAEFGWPKGPVTAVCLFNEPWEGGGISGWLSDMMRYRDAYKAMAAGVLAAREENGVEVLVGGCDSSSNAMDKLFGDGSTDFLPIFDYVSIHYQGLSAPSLNPMWRDRQGAAPYGRVKIWDTESWVANSDDRISPLLASWRAAGYDRLMGVDSACIADESWVNVRREDGKKQEYRSVNPGSPAAAFAAAGHFIGNRPFKEFLFKNGLPWVMVFDGLAGEEDGTIVVCGDILAGDTTLFRTVQGLNVKPHKDELRRQLTALAADADPKQRRRLMAELAKHEPIIGGTMTLPASDAYYLYDYYGNISSPANGKLVIGLSAQGFFLRGDGKPGSFQKLVAALRDSRIDGYEPVEIIAHDMTMPVDKGAELRLSITNVLNRPIRGILAAKLGDLKLSVPAEPLDIPANETRQVELHITGGKAVPQNTYPLLATFDSGADGTVEHDEEMHCNVIARRTIKVDGDLADWEGVLPQVVTAGGDSPSTTEQMWYPNKAFAANVQPGLATAYLAYDDTHFFFAARVADNTPDEGVQRFETFNADEFFFPDEFWVVDKENGRETKRFKAKWPEGIRHYVYRKDPVLPAGNGLVNFDNIQIAFNIIPEQNVKDKGAYPYPPGTMPHYIPYKDTDYEYALNQVSAKYGGGTEIWRLQAPGMPRKHFYPRQPKTPQDGAVKDSQLVVKRDGNTRIVEAAIPWSEIPWVQKQLDSGLPIKFSFRVNDNKGPGYELAHDRSVSKVNNLAFHCDWVQHWANELQFGFEK